MNTKDAQQKHEDDMIRRILTAVFLHGRISSGKFGMSDHEVKFARELANAVMKEPKT